MKLPIIQSLWIGKPLSNVEKLCIQSFLDHGHEFHLYVYDDVEGIPDGTVVKDGNAIVSVDKIFYTKRNQIAPFSDYFRYTLLYKLGGWWVDMDFICIKPFSFANKIIINLAPESADYRFPNSPLCFPVGHLAMKELITQCENFDTQIRYSVFYYLFSPIVAKYKLESFAQPSLCFTPTIDPFLDWYQDGIDLPSGTHAVHLTNSKIVQYNFFNKNDVFHENSLFELLKKEHSIANSPNAKIITPRMIITARQNRPKLNIANKRKQHRIITAIVAVLSFAIGLWLGY